MIRYSLAFMPADSDENTPPPSTRRPWKRLLVFFVVLLSAWIGGILLYDEGLKPYDDLQPPAPRNAGPQTNGYHFLLERYGPLPRPTAKDRTRWYEMANGRMPLDFAFLAKMNMRRENAAVDLKAAVEMPDWEFVRDTKNDVSSSWILDFCLGLSTQALLALHHGDFPLAFEILQNIHHASLRHLGCGAGMTQFIVASSMLNRAGSLCCRLLDLGKPDRAGLEAMDRLWERDPPAPEAWQTVIRWAAVEFDSWLEFLNWQYSRDGKQDLSTRLEPWFIKKNMTLNRHYGRLRWSARMAFRILPSREAAEAAGLFKEKPSRRWSRWLDPNWRGREFADGGNNILARGDRSALFASRAMRVRLALYRWRLDHPDSWPATLEELTPTYLPAIPVDPWNGNPLLWDKPSRTIYSVGSDWRAELPSVEKELERGSLGWFIGGWESPGLLVELPTIAGKSP